MAVSLVKVRNRIRARLRDTDGRKASFDGPAVDMAIAEAWIYFGSQLPAPLLYLANGLTINARSDAFTLPVSVAGSGYGTGTTEYAGDIRIQMVQTGIYIQKRTQSELDLYRNGAPTIVYALPQFFCIYMDAAQVVQGRIWPGAAVSQVCNLWTTLRVEDLRDYVGTGGAEGMDTVTIPGTREAVLALEAHTAGELLSRMPPQDAIQRGLNPASAADWKQEASDLLWQEESKHHGIKSTGRIQRYVP